MAAGNNSSVTEFILAGLTEHPGLQLPLFLLFLGIYVVTVVGNLVMITLTGLSSRLHTPMYYFLSSLSFIDLCQSTVITPNAGELCDREECYLLPSMCDSTLLLPRFVVSECHMLAVLAYDRYVAICNPLLYNVTMSFQLCSCMVVGVYIMGLAGATAHTGCMLRVLFCKADVINHYLCDLFLYWSSPAPVLTSMSCYFVFQCI